MIVQLFDVGIRQDKEGRYCLNDIHSAAISSGVTKDIRPNEWLSLKNTQRKVEILNAEKWCNYAVISKAGRYGGTYVCKELIYSYAMCISEEFELYVIRVFDQAIQEEAKRKVFRGHSRIEFKPMTDAIKSLREDLGLDVKFYHFSNEFDMINVLGIGMTAKKFKLKHGIPESGDTREYFNRQQIEVISYLQRTNTTLIELGMSFDERKEKLKELLDKKFPRLPFDNPKQLAYNHRTN